MPCATCGAAVGPPEESEGGIKDGQFKEVYTCVNGHRGTVKGEASDPPRKWSKTGPVFNEAIVANE